MLVFKNEPYVSIREFKKISPELFWLDYQILFLYILVDERYFNHGIYQIVE